ncbi:tellurite resistance/C4-dicarboxylate transporter family protein [Streptomyces purpureus]|uniref:Membrane protein n=1 Tax=Streptomyces purpureus TaxID=1951 RepID=A0A918GW37_9ACTN|nr:tellurite resistance/C4-dicarboxylate transporter family protein [Streptomyces purpureus]GGT12344.1 membrane protein [Streptomyces purpureus]
MNVPEAAAPARSAAPVPFGWAGLTPAAGAAVMATGILSVGLHLAGHEVVSLVALVLAGALWVVLAVHFTGRLLRARAEWSAQAHTPPALTAVAATTVLGTRLALLGWHGLAQALLALATVLWAVLLISVLRHLTHRMSGAVFLVCVATQGLAVLAATEALAGSGEWLARAALVLVGLALLLYADALRRFDVRQVLTGAGDQWLAGGALAISALAAAALAASPLWRGDLHDVLRALTLALLTLDLAWYVVLLAAEALRPRPAYDVRRWATVFPLGMSAAASLAASNATGIRWLSTLGQTLLWIAVTAWLLTLAGALRAYGPAGRRVPRR